MKNRPRSERTSRKISLRATRGRRLVFSVLKCLGVAALASATQVRADTTWIGGTSQDWTNPANWSNGVPDDAANNGAAIINTATGNFPIFTTGNQTDYDIILGNGGTNAGRLDQTAGTLATGTGNWFFVGSGSSGNSVYNLADTTTTGGTATGFGTGSGSLNVGGANTGTAGRLILGNGGTGTGTFNMNTSGTLSANDAGVGVLVGTNGGSGVINLDNGFITSSQIWFGDSSATSTGTLNMSGGVIIANGNVIFGRNGGTGNLNMTGGALNTTAEIWFGNAAAGTTGTATATIGAGASTSSTTWTVIGRAGNTTGTVTLNGGTMNVRVSGNTGNLELADFDTSKGTLNINAGSTVTLQNNASLNFGNVNNAATGVGIVNQNGGTVTAYSDSGNTVAGATGVVTLGAGTSAGAYTYNLNGGTLTVAGVTRTTSGAATSVFNFNGGTLTPTATTATFMQGLTAANVRNGGALFDTNGYNVTVGQALVHSTVTGDNATDGGLAKTGAGTLTLSGANTYTGPTAIGAGTVSFTTAQSTVGSATVAGSATLGVRALSGATTLSLSSLTFGASNLALDFNNLANPTAALIGSTGVLTLNGTVNVSLANTSALTTTANNTTLRLLTYSSQTGTGTFNLTTTAVGHSTYTLNDTATALYLSVTAANNVWQGTVNSTWDINTTSNWSLGKYLDGDQVIFDDTASQFNVNIAAAVAPGSVTFSNTTARPYTLSGAAITGSGGVTLNGTGTVVLTNANTYTGTTTVGTGATLQLGNGTTDGSINNSGGIVDNGTLVYNRTTGSTFTYGNVISGTGAVTINGPGTQIFTAANTYTGGTNISAGTLQITNTTGAANVGVFNLNGGAFQINSAAANFNYAPTINLTAAGSSVGTVGSQINYTGALNGNNNPFNVANTATGVLYMNGTATNVTQFNVQTGAMGFDITSANNRGTAPVNVANGAALWIAGINANPVTNNITLNGGNGINNGGALYYQGGSTTPAPLTGNITLAATSGIGGGAVANALTLSGIVSGAGGLNNLGGTTVLSGPNTYTGGTTVTGGALQANNNMALGTAGVTVAAVAGAQLQLGSGVNVANPLTINGGGVAVQGIVYVPTANANATYSGAITINAAANAGGDFAANGGTLTLTGPITSSVPVTTRIGTVVFTNPASSYTQLNVQQGTLQIGANNVIPVAASVGLGASGAATLDLAGFNQTLAGLTLTANTGIVTNSGTANSTLTTTGTATFGGVIQKGTTNTMALAVSSGTLTLTGANSYAGGTTINGGTLVANRGNNANNPVTSALGNPQVAQNITVNNGGTLNLAQGDTLGGSDSAIVATLVINAGGTVSNVGTNFNALGNVVLNGGALTTSGGAVAAYQSYSLNGSVTVGGTTASSVSVTGAGNAFNGLHLGANTAFTVADATNSAASDLNVSAPLVDRNGNFGGTAGGFTKTGLGTMTLSAANTYTGTTTVNGGILTVAAGGSINGSATVQVTSGTLTLQNTAVISDTGLLSLASGTALRLDAASGTTETIGTLVINGVGRTAGVYTAAQLNALGGGVTFSSANGETLTVSMTAVPEPSALALGALGIAALTGCAQRRRMQS